MKTIVTILLFLSCFAVESRSQPPTNNAEFDLLGKKYTANYDASKHALKFSEELSYEVYDETGVIIKRGYGSSIDFRNLFKKGAGEKTYTVKLYRKYSKSWFRKNKSIKQKGEIGTMLVTDEIE